MKKLIFFIVLLAITSTTFAQMNVFARYTPEASDVLPTINYFGKKKISEKVNLTVFALANKGFAEILVGVTYSPKKWISIGVSTGIESSDAGYRFGSSLWLGKDKNSLLVVAEKGKGQENYFYRATYKHQLTDKFHIGATAWRFHGIGPLAGYKIEELDVTLWIAPLYDAEFEVPRLVLGTTIKF